MAPGSSVHARSVDLALATLLVDAISTASAVVSSENERERSSAYDAIRRQVVRYRHDREASPVRCR
jgi:hypothetical protein